MSQIYCPSCHAPHSAADQFCGNCGTRMTASVAQAQPMHASNAYSPPQAQALPPNSQGYGQPQHSSPQGYAQPQGYAPSNAYQPQGFGNPQGQPYSAGINSPLLAGFWIRFFANFIDGLIVFIVQLLLAAIGIQNNLIGILFSGVYFVGFWTAISTSPGKMMMGLRIETQDGKPLTMGSALLRYFGYVVSSLLLGIGYLMIAFDDRKRGLHDMIAKTRVVYKG